MTKEEKSLIEKVKKSFVKDNRERLLLQILIDTLAEKGIIDKDEIEMKFNAVVDTILLEQFNELSEDEKNSLLGLSTILNILGKSSDEDEEDEKENDNSEIN